MFMNRSLRNMRFSRWEQSRHETHNVSDVNQPTLGQSFSIRSIEHRSTFFTAHTASANILLTLAFPSCKPNRSFDKKTKRTAGLHDAAAHSDGGRYAPVRLSTSFCTAISHSYRNASIGFRRAALLAGLMPKKAPTMNAKMKAVSTDNVLTST